MIYTLAPRLLGQVYDEDADLCWTLFRCFDADTGRWLSPDPLGIAGGQDLFGFDGSPTHIVDPLGLTGDPHGKGEAKKSGWHLARGRLLAEMTARRKWLTSRVAS